MQARKLTILAAIAAVAILAAVWASRERAPDSTATVGGPLVPGLEENVNEVTKVEIGAGAEPLVTIERDETTWTVAQKSGYPADVNKLRETLLGLSIAEVLEEKSSNPENYGQLGVTDEIAEDATGAHLTITGLGQPAELIIGDTARGGSSTYARRVGEETALLVSGNLDIDRQPVEWLRRDVLDVTADSMQSVTLVHPDGRTIEIAKETRNLPDFTVAEIPEGQKLVSASETNSLASALTGLRLEDVEPAEGFDPEEAEAVHATYRLFDGRVFTVYAFERDGRKLIHVQPAFDTELAQRFAPPAATEPAAAGPASEASTEGTADDAAAATGEPGEAASAPATDEADDTVATGDAGEPAAGDTQVTAAGTEEEQRIAMDGTREKAQLLQARLEPWLFEVTDYKYEQLTHTPDDLFEPIAPEPEAEPAAEIGSDAD